MGKKIEVELDKQSRIKRHESRTMSKHKKSGELPPLKSIRKKHKHVDYTALANLEEDEYYDLNAWD